MRLTDFARQLPVEVWDLFQPLLPPVVWCGNGRPPASNSDCLHALFYVLVTGIAWRMLPKGFPSYKTVQRRLKVWLSSTASGPRGHNSRSAMKRCMVSTGISFSSTARKSRQKRGRPDWPQPGRSRQVRHGDPPSM